MNPFANLSVASNIGLLTLLALAIPLAIHLFSRTKGKLIKFADISLIGKVQQKPVAQLYLTQRKLLLLRLLLLVLLSMILSQCVWQASTTNSTEESATLVSPLWIKMASTEQKRSLADEESNSLEEKNVFLLTESYPTLSREQLLSPTFATSLQPQTTNLWMRAHHFSLLNPYITRAHIYVTNSLQQFIGSKIATSMMYEWHVLPQTQQSSTELNVEIIKPINVLLILDQDKQGDKLASESKWRHALSIIQHQISNKIEIHDVSADEYSQQGNYDWIIDLSQQHNISELHSLDSLVKYEDLPHFPLLMAEKLLSKQQFNLDLQFLKVTEEQLINKSEKALPSQSSTQRSAFNTHSSPTKWLYILLLVCFCIERIYSERTNLRNASFAQKDVN